MRQHLWSPIFRGGLLYSEGATVRQGCLAYHLRSEILRRGCTVFEDTLVQRATEVEVGFLRQTPSGDLKATNVVLATNVALAGLPSLRPNVKSFSSYACMSRNVPEAVETHAWRGAAGAADLV
ncbi:FAD-dependent oxidoreductase [Acidisoma cellulosilytica]|uniref:FAD-dependent oxidoreductase n=1 Tax=Acidisoma cellulosilyticum TaxID=2802395 RepID=A0A964E6M5_9PROT|nr:FAD-dependent oxidoreductase [Acidisoma cellulosilyticum]